MGRSVSRAGISSRVASPLPVRRFLCEWACPPTPAVAELDGRRPECRLVAAPRDQPHNTPPGAPAGSALHDQPTPAKRPAQSGTDPPGSPYRTSAASSRSSTSARSRSSLACARSSSALRRSISARSGSFRAAQYSAASSWCSAASSCRAADRRSRSDSLSTRRTTLFDPPLRVLKTSVCGLKYPRPRRRDCLSTSRARETRTPSFGTTTGCHPLSPEPRAWRLDAGS